MLQSAIFCNLAPLAAAGWQQTFFDGFDTFNSNVWTKMDNYGHTGDEKQCYMKDDVYIENGKLVLRTRYRPSLGGCGGRAWTSGAVVSASDGHYLSIRANETGNSTRGFSADGSGASGFYQTHGRWEWRAKLPKALPTIWPALWLMPDDAGIGGTQKACWPNGGEIDVMEAYGGLDGNPMISSYHFSDSGPSNPWQCNGPADRGFEVGRSAPGDYTSAYHTFVVEWTKDHLKFLVDGKQTGYVSSSQHSLPNWPFHMIMNTAICALPWCQTGGLDANQVVKMYIDYVKVSKWVDGPSPSPSPSPTDTRRRRTDTRRRRTPSPPPSPSPAPSGDSGACCWDSVGCDHHDQWCDGSASFCESKCNGRWGFCCWGTLCDHHDPWCDADPGNCEGDCKGKWSSNSADGLVEEFDTVKVSVVV